MRPVRFRTELNRIFMLATLGASCSSEDQQNCGMVTPEQTWFVPAPSAAEGGQGGEGGTAEVGAGGDTDVGFDCVALCGGATQCQPAEPGFVMCVSHSAPQLVCYEPGVVPGRRPAGFPKAAGATTMGELLAEMARLEAASVVAFRRLSQELEVLGAPRDLVSRAASAARQERRHARLVGALAREHGARTPPIRVAPRTARSRFEVALENETEGCVRETFSALVAQHQATCASSARVRAVAERLAPDEAEHARLSFAVSAFLRGTLDKNERRALDRARARTFRDLGTELAVDLPVAWRTLLGLPGRCEAERLLRALAVGVPDLARAA